jgi:Na+-driven multidrug efflux pump
MQAAMNYLAVMCIGFLPFALTQAYGTTIRSYGETVAPMIASFLAVGVNLAGNYILIFGKFGAPRLGVIGAAAATVLSRFVELIYIVVWAHTHTKRVPFIVGALKTLYVPAELTVSCIQKGTPLLLNEALWSGGQAVLTQCYSVRGLSVVSAFNISQTLANVFNVAFIAMGSATAIIIGQKLGEWGESRVQDLKDEAWRLTYFSVFLCLISAGLMISISGLFPKIYNTTREIRALATGLICITACFMPVHAFNNASYFIIRSGGKTLITFLFDSCFCWVASIPAAFFLAHYTQVPILPMYAAVCSIELVKVVIGRALVNKGIWIRDITV